MTQEKGQIVVNIESINRIYGNRAKGQAAPVIGYAVVFFGTIAQISKQSGLNAEAFSSNKMSLEVKADWNVTATISKTDMPAAESLKKVKKYSALDMKVEVEFHCEPNGLGELSDLFDAETDDGSDGTSEWANPFDS